MKILALVLFGLVATSLAHAEEYPASEKFAHNYPVSAQAEFSLSNLNGSVKIIAWEKNEIALEAEKRAFTADDLPKILIKIDATPDHVTVETEHQRAGWFGNRVKGEVRYTLHVPAGTHLRKIEAVNADISIHDVHGEVIASTVNGNIEAQAIAAAAKLSTVNGNVEAEVAPADQKRVISVETVNGNCKVVLASSLAANIHASTVNGHLDCSLPLDHLKSSRNNLEGSFGKGVVATIKAETVNGDIAFDCL